LDEPASPPPYYPPVVCRLSGPPNIFELEAPSGKLPMPNPSITSIAKPGVRHCCLLAPDTLATRPFVDIGKLGIHNAVDEVSGLVYTGKAGFIDLGHLRDNCDLTRYIYEQIRAGAGYGAPILTTHGEALLLRCPAYELKVARGITFDDSVGYEIFTYDSLGPGKHHSSFSPEDLCSNNLGTIVAEKAISSMLLSPGTTFDDEVTKILPGILSSLDAQAPAETQKAFDLIKKKWVSYRFSGSIASPFYLKRRNFSHVPWKAGHSSDSATPSWITDPPPTSGIYEYKNTDTRVIKNVDFPTEIAAIRKKAEKRYGSDYNTP